MALIAKFSGYAVLPTSDDPRELNDIPINTYAPETKGLTYTLHKHIKVSKFTWDEELPINFEHCDLKACEAYFPHDKPDYTVMDDRRLPRPGETWKHFKGNVVKIIGLSYNTEWPNEVSVIYEHDTILWNRPLDMFMEPVDRVKYPDAGQKYRFERVD